MSLGLFHLLINCLQVIILRDVADKGAQLIQFRDDLPSLEESDLKLVLDWLIGVVCHDFEERLIFLGMEKAKLI